MDKQLPQPAFQAYIEMNNPYLPFIQSIEDGLALAKESPRPLLKHSRLEADSKVLLFSPHPDDECITGLLPLRLMREARKQIINVPVTFGSMLARQQDRSKELDAACDYLGWDNFRAKDSFDPLAIEDILEALTEFNPEIIFFPHEDDWNSRHIATHKLVVDALGRMGPDFSCIVVETEFWKPMHSPNLMVEADAGLVADLVAATSLHAGEVARNPFHLLLPAWMQDNVRRGAEIVGGQGGSAPAFSFATLYRIRKWEHGQLVDNLVPQGLSLPASDHLIKEIF
ncbi:PIG-L deacetylase family protein [Luteolibacter algae]|uniref:PIG-L deacetylase family protein n=1 Tax=Luteolibacter algae TaxID=454151 RepID=A0ABW5DBF7_9BACT